VTVKLKNVSGGPVYLGRADGRRVEANEVVEVDGKLAADQPDDATVVGEGDAARAYPHSVWSQVSSKENG
jgi:hypothetical protein